MQSKSEVLDHLKQDELLATMDRFGLEIGDRRIRREFIEAWADSLDAGLADPPTEMHPARLAESRRVLNRMALATIQRIFSLYG